MRLRSRSAIVGMVLLSIAILATLGVAIASDDVATYDEPAVIDQPVEEEPAVLDEEVVEHEEVVEEEPAPEPAVIHEAGDHSTCEARIAQLERENKDLAANVEATWDDLMVENDRAGLLEMALFFANDRLEANGLEPIYETDLEFNEDGELINEDQFLNPETEPVEEPVETE